MNLREEDKIAYDLECKALKQKYSHAKNMAYRRASNELGLKYKQKEAEYERELEQQNARCTVESCSCKACENYDPEAGGGS